jgi:hypothetical protein
MKVGSIVKIKKERQAGEENDRENSCSSPANYSVPALSLRTISASRSGFGRTMGVCTPKRRAGPWASRAYSIVFGNAVGIGNHALFLILELVTALSSLICALRSGTLLFGLAKSAVCGFYWLNTNRGLGVAVCGLFGLAAFLQIVSFVADCAWVDRNVMPEEAVNAEFLAVHTNPYDLGRTGNWNETLWPAFPPRPDRPVRPVSLQKNVWGGLCQ